jgi:hypothetical protein
MRSSDPGFHMDEVLRELSREMGADYITGDGPYRRMIRTAKHYVHSYGTVTTPAGQWTVSIGGYTRESERTFTQLYAPYLNPGGFRFWVTRTDFLTRLSRKLGLWRQIDVGFPECNETFFIHGNNDARVRTLFAEPRFRELIQAQPDFSINVHDKPWKFAIGAEPDFPEDVLVYEARGAVTDVGRLKALADGFAATLEQLCRTGSARREPPGVMPSGLFGFKAAIWGKLVDCV